MVPSLTEELLAAYNNTGSVVKKKEEVYKVAQANKAFSHLK
jgi:small subunit ribosomal protein S7